MEKGLIVSRHVLDPGCVPVSTHYGTVVMNCDGTFNYKEAE